MNHAWISGRAGCAVVVTPEDSYLLEAGVSKPPRLCSLDQLNNLRNLAPDLVRSDAGPFPFQDVQQNLEAAWSAESALTMLLTTLDVELSSSLRSEAAGVAERLLEVPEVREGVRWRLLGTPLPCEADLGGTHRGWVAVLICEVLETRALVKLAGRVWDQLAFDSPLGPENLARLRQLCILYGGFAEQITSLREARYPNLHDWLERVPFEERDFLGSASLNFLDRWSAELERHFPDPRVQREEVREEVSLPRTSPIK